MQHPIDATNLGACPPVPEVPEARDQPFGAASYVCRVWKTAIWGVHYIINIRRRRYFNKGVWTLKFTLMLRFKFVAQAVPHQCIAHHGAEHRAAAAAEKDRKSVV